MASLLSLASDQLDILAFKLFQVTFDLVFAINKPRLLTAVAEILVSAIGLIAVLSSTPRGDYFTPNILLKSPDQLSASYDYIVVGGGISGSLVARRLADRNMRTLLIHGPGTVPGVIARMPIFNIAWHGNPDHDLLYPGPPQGSAWANASLTYNSGADLGGSMLLSGQMWSYGKKADYLCWKKEFNISSKFDHARIRQFGQRHENAGSDVVGVDYPYGTAGEIKLSRAAIWQPFNRLQELFEKGAALTTNTSVLTDVNSNKLGFGKVPHAVEPRTGYISSPSRAFFENKNSPLLDIVTEHMVRKIIFDTSTPPRAVGVEFVNAKSSTKVYTARASKKVILAAGAIRTPQLLMLSGVGPQAVLNEFSIPPVAIREGVGQNLHDHYDIGFGSVCFDSCEKGYKDISLSRLLEFASNATGVSRVPLGTQSYGFFASKQTNISTCLNPEDPDTCMPDFEVIFHYFGQNSQVAAKHYYAYGLSDENLYRDFYLAGKDRDRSYSRAQIRYGQKDCLLLTSTLLHPEYRGQVKLLSKDALDKPLVDLKTTSNARDMRLLGELWQTTKKIGNAAFAEIGGKVDDAPYPECLNITDRDSVEFGACQTKRYLKTAWHMAGSCRIGAETDPKACVGENFHVIGVKGLVVVDASTLPCPTSGHMLPTVSSMAEMAVEDILVQD